MCLFPVLDDIEIGVPSAKGIRCEIQSQRSMFALTSGCWKKELVGTFLWTRCETYGRENSMSVGIGRGRAMYLSISSEVSF